METDWIQDEILNGLTRLLSLSLVRQPAAEIIAVTAQNWLVAFNRNRVLDQGLDAPRIRAAFDTLVATREEWPAPRHFAESFDATSRDQLALARDSRKADPERAAAACAEIARELRMDGKTAAAGPDA